MAAARLSLAGAVLLVASLFFTWVELPVFSGATTGTPTQATETSLDGWTVLEAGDTLLLFVALAAIGLVASRNTAGPWLLVLAGIALAVVLSFLFSSVPMTEVYKEVYSSPGYTYSAAKGTGIWIAAAGTAVLLFAGVIQARASLPGRRPGSRRRPRASGEDREPASEAAPEPASEGRPRREYRSRRSS